MINKERIIRHMARSTPDRCVFEVDPLVDTQGVAERKFNEAREHFMYMMRIKHKEAGRVDIYEDNMLAKYPGVYVFIMQYRK